MRTYYNQRRDGDGVFQFMFDENEATCDDPSFSDGDMISPDSVLGTLVGKKIDEGMNSFRGISRWGRFKMRCAEMFHLKVRIV